MQHRKQHHSIGVMVCTHYLCVYYMYNVALYSASQVTAQVNMYHIPERLNFISIAGRNIIFFFQW
jgi:hypothetical protein